MDKSLLTAIVGLQAEILEAQQSQRKRAMQKCRYTI